MLILGIETSCDETAAAVVEDGKDILSDIISSQVAVHSPYGGVVPELASRKHVEMILPVIDQALKGANKSLNGLDAIAVTQGPGLVGALLVGVSVAKALSYSMRKPLIAVNHLEGHMHAAFLGKETVANPLVCLVVSGGHTALYRVDANGQVNFLGTTRDDAAGEAFDKVAKLLGLGYPGGVVIDRLAADGNPHAFQFPRAYLEKDSLDFSFSGVKTAVANFVRRLGHPTKTAAGGDFRVEDLVASFQEAVVDVLVDKTIMAAKAAGVRDVAVVGGVSANRRLRLRLKEEANCHGLQLHLPPLRYCTDNAVMIAAAAYTVWKRNGFTLDFMEIDAVSRWFY
jgi:N6-L-threonylcarbamoyladenine synthase